MRYISHVRWLSLVLLLRGTWGYANEHPPVEIVYRVDPVVDVPVTLGGLALWISPYLVVGDAAPKPDCDPCDPSKLNSLDRHFVGYHNADARTGANALLGLPAVYALFDFIDVGPKRWRGYLSDFLVMTEALAWDGALQEIVRRAVRRPRPYLYQAGVYPTDRTSPEASFSFYSGHTSATFNIAVSFAYTYSLRHPGSKWRALVWSLVMAAASVEPFLRVGSGDHFPTDVIVGAAIGSTLGLVIPALHRVKANTVPGVRNLRLVPNVEGDRTTVSLAGNF